MITRAKLRSDPNQQLHTPTPTVTPGRKDREKKESRTKSRKYKLPPQDEYSINNDIEEEKESSKYIDSNSTDTDESEAYGWHKEEEKAIIAEKKEQHHILDNALFSNKKEDDNDSLLQLSIKSYISNKESLFRINNPSKNQLNEQVSDLVQSTKDQNSNHDMTQSSCHENSDSPSKDYEQQEKKSEDPKVNNNAAPATDTTCTLDFPGKKNKENDEEDSFDIVDEKQYELEKDEQENDRYDQENSIQNTSTLSEGTTKGRNTTRAEESSQDTSSSLEAEDDVNTVASNNTATNIRGVQPPKYTRYRLMITPITESEEESPEDTTPIIRIRSKLMAFYQYMREVDKESQILNWIVKDNFVFLPIEKVPHDVLGLKTYFQGIRGNMKNDRKAYISFSVHTPNDSTLLEHKMQEWAESFGFSLLPCLIQSSTARYVGWLAYSSYYTEMEDWKKGLQKNTGYEWGLKIVAVTNADKDEKWNKRLKAVGLFVPDERADQAQAEISKAMARVRRTTNRPCMATDRYLFVKPEEEMTTLKERTTYKHLLSRHRSHSEALEGKLFNYIKVPLDRRMVLKDKSKMTVRQMILSIKVEDKDSRLYQQPLFHMVDFVPDTSKLWMGNRTGPGGPAHVFTYYSPMAGEAQTMVRGIGRYIGRMFGSEVVAKIFDSVYWDTTKGWRWSDSKKKFETPEQKLLDGNMAHDYNLGTITILRQMQLEEEQKNIELKRKTQPSAMNIITPENEDTIDIDNNDLQLEATDLLDEDDKDSNSELTDITKAAMEEEQEIIKKIMNAEEDYQDDEGVKSAVSHVELLDDTSVASSITQDSTNSDRISGLSVSSRDSKRFSNSSVSKDLLERLYEKGISAQEFKQRVNKYQIFRTHKNNIRKEALIEEFISQKQMPFVTEEDDEDLQEDNTNYKTERIQGEDHDKEADGEEDNNGKKSDSAEEKSHNIDENSDVQVSSTDTDKSE